MKAQTAKHCSAAESANETRDAAFTELAEETEPIDEPPSVSRIVSDYKGRSGRGSLGSENPKLPLAKPVGFFANVLCRSGETDG